MSITATISTKNRYDTTLPLAIASIANQTVPPEKFILFDDSDTKVDLRQSVIYQRIFDMLDSKKIEWRVIFGQGKGQVANHQTALDNADTDYIWRLDDDNIAEYNVLECLLSSCKDNTAAVGGLVLHSPGGADVKYDGSKMGNALFSDGHLQWTVPPSRDPVQVDNLYSTFIYRVDFGRKVGGYCGQLSPVGHREETIFTYSMKAAGYDVVVDPRATTWHVRSPDGGIRTYNAHPEFWKHDDSIFQGMLNKWSIAFNKYKLIVLANGRGDHVVFKSILPDIREKFADSRIVIAACYPELFIGEQGVDVIGIDRAKTICYNAGVDIDMFNVYKFCADRKWQGTLVEAYREIYL